MILKWSCSWSPRRSACQWSRKWSRWANQWFKRLWRTLRFFCCAPGRSSPSTAARWRRRRWRRKSSLGTAPLRRLARLGRFCSRCPTERRCFFLWGFLPPRSFLLLWYWCSSFFGVHVDPCGTDVDWQVDGCYCSDFLAWTFIFGFELKFGFIYLIWCSNFSKTRIYLNVINPEILQTFVLLLLILLLLDLVIFVLFLLPKIQSF